VLEDGVGDGGLAAAAQTVQDVDAIAGAGFDSGAEAVHLPGTVTQHHRRVSDRWAAHRIRPGPVGGIVVMLGNVLVARRLVHAALSLGPRVVAVSHRCLKFWSRPA
jgi:hypothetical protein